LKTGQDSRMEGEKILLSKYVIKIPVDNKETLLYNSITKSLISLPTSKEDVEIFIKKLNQEELQYLSKELYLQFDEINEEKLVDLCQYGSEKYFVYLD